MTPLGGRIREARRNAGLSQEKLAEQIGVSRQAVTKWEAGQAAPSTENLLRLAEALHTPLETLLGTEPDSVLRPLEDDVDRTLLLHALHSLPARERKIISMRFGLGLPEAMTQKEVADLMGISQSYISRLEKRIIARMRRDILKNYV